ncbi:hypothetical protein BU14_0328s0031 [Porphyra umbilicalis]|uniref:YlxR domain-containing protein n=1 Tax=Porphyra umbilicalis TaxID=2786 RepID=A0A1X6NYS5_PORUM|nr:hypothetical protein BU14_0328s0031 [Porphyra umbilicalis]|eukprot:OSX73779.1 hypothetical protein BU14_0328s0031 [Porphyra umbilicalis]
MATGAALVAPAAFLSVPTPLSTRVFSTSPVVHSHCPSRFGPSPLRRCRVGPWPPHPPPHAGGVPPVTAQTPPPPPGGAPPGPTGAPAKARTCAVTRVPLAAALAAASAAAAGRRAPTPLSAAAAAAAAARRPYVVVVGGPGGDATAAGRSAYVSRSPAAVAAARRRRLLDRALRAPVPDNVWAALEGMAADAEGGRARREKGRRGKGRGGGGGGLRWGSECVTEMFAGGRWPGGVRRRQAPCPSRRLNVIGEEKDRHPRSPNRNCVATIAAAPSPKRSRAGAPHRSRSTGRSGRAARRNTSAAPPTGRGGADKTRARQATQHQQTQTTKAAARRANTPVQWRPHLRPPFPPVTPASAVCGTPGEWVHQSADDATPVSTTDRVRACPGAAPRAAPPVHTSRVHQKQSQRGDAGASARRRRRHRHPRRRPPPIANTAQCRPTGYQAAALPTPHRHRRRRRERGHRRLPATNDRVAAAAETRARPPRRQR